MSTLRVGILLALFPVLAFAGGPFNQYSPAAGVQFNATGNTSVNTAATGANFATLFGCAAKDVVYSSAANSITCDAATHAITFDPVGGGFGTGVLTVSDTLKLFDPIDSVTWLTFDPANLGIQMDLSAAVGSTLIFNLDASAIRWQSGTTNFNVNQNGDLIYQANFPGGDVVAQISNSSAVANTYGGLAGGNSAFTNELCWISQLVAGATTLPAGAVCPLSSTTLPIGGDYAGGRANGTLSFFKGGIEALRLLHSSGMTGDDVFVHSRTSLPTTAVDGFLYLESTAGIPTGVPTNVAAVNNTVPCIVDSADNRLYCYANSAWRNVADFSSTPVLSGTTGSIGGGALLAGACSSGTVSVSGVSTGQDIHATPVTYPGDGFWWEAYNSSGTTVTVKVCASIAGTPTATNYNVRVNQ